MALYALLFLLIELPTTNPTTAINATHKQQVKAGTHFLNGNVFLVSFTFNSLNTRFCNDELGSVSFNSFNFLFVFHLPHTPFSIFQYHHSKALALYQ